MLLKNIKLRRTLPDSVRLETDSARILSIKGYLHGLVPTISRIKDPSGNTGALFIDGSDKNHFWFTNCLKQRGYLARNTSGQYACYTLTRKKLSLSLGKVKEAEARQIGRCIGSAVNIGAISTDIDLVLLSVCTDDDYMLRAISGEIDYIYERINTLKEKINKVIEEESSYMAAHKLMRNFESVFTSINSGCMKFNWYILQDKENGLYSIEKFINKVETTFANSYLDDARDKWVQLWPKSFPCPDKSIAEEISASPCIVNMGVWLYALHISFLFIDSRFVDLAKKNKQLKKIPPTLSASLNEAIDKYLFVYEKYAKFLTQSLDGKLIGLQKTLLSYKDAQQSMSPETMQDIARDSWRLLTYFSQYIAKGLLDESIVISNIYGGFSQRSPLPYSVYLYSEGNDNIIYKVLSEGLESVGIKGYYYLPDHMNSLRRGLWVLFPGNKNSTDATKLATYILRKIGDIGIPIYMVVFGQQLSTECIVRYDYSTEIARNFFYTRLEQLRKFITPQDKYASRVVFINEISKDTPSEAQKFDTQINADLKFIHCTIDADDIVASRRKFTISTCEFNNQDALGCAMKDKKIVILTATATETSACLDGSKSIGNSPIPK